MYIRNDEMDDQMELQTTSTQQPMQQQMYNPNYMMPFYPTSATYPFEQAFAQTGPMTSQY